jgi:acyl dehydratase
MNTMHAFVHSLPPRNIRHGWLSLGLGVGAAMAAFGAPGCAAAAGKPQVDFATPEQAADALVEPNAVTISTSFLDPRAIWR